jgi:uncharacterized membrane protein YkvA (DUF1232 family)
MPLTITFQLSDRDLELLGNVMDRAASKVASLDETQIIAAARRVLDTANRSEQASFIKERMDKLAKLIQMLEDRLWLIGGDDRTRVRNALAYFADPDDLIPDNVPGFGLLDDAVVVDLVCGALALKHDMDAYEDFCKYRAAEELRRGASADAIPPAQWLESRRLQLQDRMRRRRSRIGASRLGRS